MKRRFYTLDVFTSRVYAGNPLAVIIDGDGLSQSKMQAIAKEMNLSETVFIQRPTVNRALARLRIFTTTRELPFAGHPVVGTWFLMAELGVVPAGEGPVHVWQQTGVDHAPQVLAKERNETWRIGILSMPAPKEMGEAYMVAFVAKKNDAAITRYFTLEYDYVLATKSTRTILCEVDRGKTTKHGEGPKLAGDFQADASAFVDAVMNIISPVSIKKDY